jgi:hypothetical protein
MSLTGLIHTLAVNRTPVGKSRKNQPGAHGAAAFERLLTLNHAGVPVSVWPGSFVQRAIPLPNAARSNCATSSLWAAFGDCPQSQRSIWCTRFWSWFPLTRRPMICTTERDTGRDWVQVFHRYSQESATPTQYLHGNADFAT